MYQVLIHFAIHNKVDRIKLWEIPPFLCTYTDQLGRGRGRERKQLLKCILLMKDTFSMMLYPFYQQCLLFIMYVRNSSRYMKWWQERKSLVLSSIQASSICGWPIIWSCVLPVHSRSTWNGNQTKSSALQIMLCFWFVLPLQTAPLRMILKRTQRSQFQAKRHQPK